MGFGNMIHRSTTNTVRKQDQINIENYLTVDSKLVMNDDTTCDVIGSINLTNIGLTSLKQLTPRIRKVRGNFNCSNNKLTDLDCAPEEVDGDFLCLKNNLSSLKGCPQIVGRNFNCFGNKLSSLEGCPKMVGRDFDCSWNQLESLKTGYQSHCEVDGDFYCTNNRVSSENLVNNISNSFNIKGSATFDFCVIIK